MKILIIRNYPTYVDIQYNTYNIQEIGLAKALIRKGHQCDIVFWAEKEEKVIDYMFDKDMHIKIFYRRGKVILKNAIYNRIDDLIENYDVVQPCEYNQYQSWALAKKYPEKTVIYHGPYYSKFNKRYNRFCQMFDLVFLKGYIKRGTKFIVKSNLAHDFLLQKGILKENIQTVGVGLDLGAFSMPSHVKIPDFISKINTFDVDLKILYVGMIEERRNILFIYDVVKLLIDMGYRVKLIMVGKGNNDYVGKCNKYVRQLGITDAIYKIEKVEQKYLPKLYEKADCFLLPTHYEIFGMVLLEAMYYGVLTITTPNGGSDLLIQDNTNGIVMECDAKQWAEKMIHLKEDKELCGNICRNAHEYIHNNYTWDAIVDGFLHSYRLRS